MNAPGFDALSNAAAIILSAGEGTRMKSSLPKALHPICGRPLVHHSVQAALDAGCTEVVVVVGHGAEDVTAYLSRAFGDRVKTALQAERRGTGDAARIGVAALTSNAPRIIVYYGDVPLVTGADLSRVARRLDLDERASLALATCDVAEPHGYGRILTDASGGILAIREERDLVSDAERAVTTINPGIFAGERAFMTDALSKLEPNNAQKELYLTDVVSIAVAQKKRVEGEKLGAGVLLGVNDRAQLAAAERMMLETIVHAHRVGGVTVRDGARIDAGVEIGKDAVVESGVVLRGKTRIGARTRIDVGCVLTNVVVGDDVVLKPYSVAQDSTIGQGAQIGPFSHLRPASEIGKDAHIGNFVETKNTKMGEGAKANHLAYLGDGLVGARSNIGAGTIFCNYDGVQKHTTTIEEDVFIGSDSQIVAPVTIGKGAYVATGTTVTKSVPADALAIARTTQENKEGYAARLRARFVAAKAKLKSGG
ncbi:MAG: bifunctional UDP-N-acetylglucosamine diphosphorylase/glucosamine-1-phosphate N-acetyltransferase GlmU [Polyangiaceae bacterium]